MARLTVRRVKYEGRRYHYQSPTLADGMNILEGANGTGKSTFSELVYHCLGGRADLFRSDSRRKHREIGLDEDNYVELDIEIDQVPFTLRRLIDTNDILVRNAVGEVQAYPVYRTQNTPQIFSDWLLERLGIEPIALQLAYGTYSGKLNFVDLARLIYHNQSPDPSGIYKPPDTGGFVSDSKVFRKAIFEILTGKSFQQYYLALSRQRDLEKRRAEAATTLEHYKDFIRRLQPKQEDLNLVFLNKRLQEVRDQLQRAVEHRRSLTQQPPRGGNIDIAPQKGRVIMAELKIADLLRGEASLVTELAHLQKLKGEMILEVTQIKKMMFAHDKLNLFSINTCPYCLREVTRELHRCVCGAEVDEKQYERFFYTNEEYLGILKSKQRSIDTIDGAIASCEQELHSCRTDLERSRSESTEGRERLKHLVEISDAAVDLAAFEDADNQIQRLREEISLLTQQQELELKREEWERNLQSVSSELDSVSLEVARLATAAEGEMESQRRLFSAKYEEMMRRTVKDCRTAALDSDYMPVINAGEYREASADVPRRLLYYATLLYLSLVETEIKFPRFLLIDTPETAGIDSERLIACLGEVANVVEDNGTDKCQVILTTGLRKYPASCSENVFGTLTDENRLLQVRK